MKKRFIQSNLVFIVLIVLSLLILASCGASESSQKIDQTVTTATGSNENQGADLPTAITIGTHPTGSSYHAVGSGIAKVITDQTPMRASVQPYAGPNAWMPELEGGTLSIGMLAGHDAGWAYTGGPGYDEPNKNIRMVLAGNRAFNVGFVVREDSGITSISELKGKRVASDYGGNVSQHENGRGLFRSVGMTWEDVEQVPVPDFVTAINLLKDGMVEAALAGGPDAAPLLEAHASKKMKALPVGDLTPEDLKDGVPPEQQAIWDEIMPGVVLDVAPAGLGILEEDMVLSKGLIMMAASTHTSPDAVYLILKAITDNLEELKPVHPWLQSWSLETMLDLNAPIPYHDGAIKFFKEKGLWTEEHDQMQKALLAK